VSGLLQRIQEAGDQARLATDAAEGRAELDAEVRGAATMLGVVIGPEVDAVAETAAVLRASRDHEGAASEAIIRAAGRGSEEERRAARLRAMPLSGRRGWLDSALCKLEGGAQTLAELAAWEAKRAAR
jgi:hypothetical protein